MFSFFRKRPSTVPLKRQLEALADCGVKLSPDASLDDLFMFHPREVHEAEPYKELIPTLGFDMERDSFGPLCDRLWMCDYERIEDDGGYVDVVARLDRMSEQTLRISRITDHVDVEGGTAWVEFDLAGSRIHWDAEVQDDWLDPTIVVKFDALLKAHRSPFRIYSNHTDFGQSAFFACFTPAEFERFRKLAKFKLRLIAEQA
ncbi:MAG: hypothetical protein K8T90_07120 [Planctomycetes bacterium]|nr:hypothetical protein [Planctomycetota bacterium]